MRALGTRIRIFFAELKSLFRDDCGRGAFFGAGKIVLIFRESQVAGLAVRRGQIFSGWRCCLQRLRHQAVLRFLLLVKAYFALDACR